MGLLLLPPLLVVLCMCCLVSRCRCPNLAFLALPDALGMAPFLAPKLLFLLFPELGFSSPRGARAQAHFVFSFSSSPVLPPPLVSLLPFLRRRAGKRCFHASEAGGVFDAGHMRADLHRLGTAGTLVRLPGGVLLGQLCCTRWERAIMLRGCLWQLIPIRNDINFWLF